MKPQRVALTLLGCAVLGAAAFLPRQSSGQAAASEDPQIEQLAADVVGQQKIISENQDKLDAKVAAVAEEVRLSRIYAGRTGGKAQ